MYCERLTENPNYTFEEELCGGSSCSEEQCLEKKARSIIPLDVCNSDNTDILNPVEIYELIVDDPNTEYSIC